MLYRRKSIILLLLVASLAIHCNCGKNPTTSQSGNPSYDGRDHEKREEKLNELDKELRSTIDKAFFLIAVEEGNAIEVKKCLDQGFDVNTQFANRETALHLAIEKNKTQVIEVLLKDGKIDIGLINKYNETPVDMALKTDNLEAVKLFIKEAKIDPNTIKIGDLDNNLLHEASRLKSEKTVSYLLDHYPNLINATNKVGATPLNLLTQQ